MKKMSWILPVILCGCGGDRGFSERLGDTQIDLSLKQKIYKVDPNLDFAVNRDVYKGDVLLTGRVGSEDHKQRIESLARSINGVENVYNHLSTKKAERFVDYTKDSGISREVKTHLLCDSEVTSSNITVRVSESVVYLLGTVKNASEKEKVLSYARNVQGVKKVVCYLR